MPNHVQNNVRLDGLPDRIAVLLKEVQNDTFGIGTMDFNKVIPMPPSLNLEAGSETDRGLKAYREFAAGYIRSEDVLASAGLRRLEQAEENFRQLHPEVTDKQWELGKTAFYNKILYGASTWYEWCTRHWGTKWNAYGYEDTVSSERTDTNSICFQTAWSAPHPILEELSRKYPDIELTHEWADEDIGSNCGKRVYLHGEMTEEYIPETDKEAVEFAVRVQGWEDASEIGLCLNADHTGYLYMWEADYTLIQVCGVPALFTPECLTNADIPDGLHRYVIHGADGQYAVIVAQWPDRDKFCGTILTGEPLNLERDGRLVLQQDTCAVFPGKKAVSFGQFMTGDCGGGDEPDIARWEVRM